MRAWKDKVSKIKSIHKGENKGSLNLQRNKERMNQTERKFHLILSYRKKEKDLVSIPFSHPSSNSFKSSQNYALGGLYSFSTIFLYSARSLKNLVQTYKSNQKGICCWIKRKDDPDCILYYLLDCSKVVLPGCLEES